MCKTRRIGALAITVLLASAPLALAPLGPLRTQGPPSDQAGPGGIEHLTRQEMELGYSLNVSKDRPKLVFFGDFESPGCRKAAPAVLSLRTGGYGLVFFHFPLAMLHPHAKLAAQAMVAAANQGAAWKALGKLFAMKLSERSLRKLGTTLGIDEDRFLADLDSESTKQRVQDSLDLCRRLKLDFVPAFFKIDPDGRTVPLDSDGVRALARPGQGRRTV